MAMKLWDKNIQTDRLIEQFTIGKDRELDLLLARYDILGSLAHITMLQSIGLLGKDELQVLAKELVAIYRDAEQGSFVIEEGVEDVHSQVELILTRRIGDTGKKIHAARSRNDQVLLDIKLFIRDEIQQVVGEVYTLFKLLLSQSEQYRHILIPGYTHLQVAMPSSFGLWFGAYAENLVDDVLMLQAAYRISDQNPLGSAAGYGSSFPINRKMTTELLGFGNLNYNVINAQMSRGKTERVCSFALASLSGTLSKMAGDICLFASQNFGFLKLPDELTTGSSIMPHKKNPDVFELIRAKCNKIQALPGEIDHIWNNLPSGYFRDMQIIKESFLPVFSEMHSCIDMASYAVARITPVEEVLGDSRYQHIFSVEAVNKLVMSGLPFREAYRKVAMQIQEGTYLPDQQVVHSHEGSLGNLCNTEIAAKMEHVLSLFNFDKKDKACQDLLNRNDGK
ncbi:MAG: argininosuccinate lyase [Bacteroidales bacterium]|nr:argininosuccinate lyase [Bacteroidales bacterium]